MSSFSYSTNFTNSYFNASKDAMKPVENTTNKSDCIVCIAVGVCVVVFFVLSTATSYYFYRKNRMVDAGIANYTYDATRVHPLTITDTVIPVYPSVTPGNTTQIAEDPFRSITNDNINSNDIENNCDIRVSNSSFTLEEAYSFSSFASSSSNSNSAFNICGYNENRENLSQSQHLHTGSEPFTLVNGRTLSIDVEVCNTPPVTAVSVPRKDRNELFNQITHPLISLRPRIPTYEVLHSPLAHAQPLTSVGLSN